MKLFTQLALVTAIATCGSAAYAMQSMDDAALSDTTGQDGITILIAPPTLVSGGVATPDVGADGVSRSNGIVIGAAVLHDKDGFTGSLGGGAIILGDAKQANATNTQGTQLGLYSDKSSGPIIVTVDASNGKAATGTGGTAPILNVGITLPGTLMIRTGDISVDGSNRAGLAVSAIDGTVTSVATGGTAGKAVKLLNSMDIALGGAQMNIQLGNTQQFGGIGGVSGGLPSANAAMIVMSGTINGGLNITGLGLNDASATLGGTYDASTNATGNGGTLGVTKLTLTDTGTPASAPVLTLSAGVNVVHDVGSAFGGTASGRGGLIITAGGNPMDVMMQDVTLGSSNSTLGDLQLINVHAAGTHIAISGH